MGERQTEDLEGLDSIQSFPRFAGPQFHLVGGKAFRDLGDTTLEGTEDAKNLVLREPALHRWGFTQVCDKVFSSF